MSNNLDYILLYCGTNNLRQDISAVEIGKMEMKVVISCKLGNKILVSVPRRDKPNVNIHQHR